MATNDSGDTGVESKDTGSTRSLRGKVILNDLAKRKAKGVKESVEFNSRGQPFGRVASEMQSYIGCLARQEVKISYKSWKDVPREVKNTIWEYVNVSYEVDPKWRAGCWESANTKWRQWKSTLYQKYIVPNKDDPAKLNNPPPCSGILQEDWSQFVISRMSDEFKKLSAEQKERCKMNLFPHRLSRKGYAGLAEQMKEELYGDDELDRAIMWKKARVVKDQNTIDTKLKTTFERIDDYIRKKEEGSFKSQGWGEDVLTCALEKSEHSGRVRGVGSYITPTTFFKQPRENKKGWKQEQMVELVEARKQLSEQDKMIKNLFDRLTKLEQRSENEDKGSCSVKQPVDFMDNELVGNHLDVEFVDKVDALQGKAVSLLGPSNKIVAYGMVVSPYGVIKMPSVDSLPKGCTCVSIDEVVDHNALLPFPCPNNSNLLEDALGSHVAWPTHLVNVKEQKKDKKIKQKQLEKKRIVKNYDSLHSSLKVLCLHAVNTLKDGHGILISLDDDVFACEFELSIHLEDIIPFCELEPISGNCILLYIWHLYGVLKSKMMTSVCQFMEPFGVSYVPKAPHEERARALFQGLERVSPSQLAIVPCNVGNHWILTIIDPHKEIVSLVDPLFHRNRDNSWKEVVNKAITMFNAKIGRRGKKQPNWEIIKAPLQPDNKQCGFFVMRYMKEIIDELANNGSISLKSLFENRRYSQEEIDEVRIEWANCALEHI